MIDLRYRCKSRISSVFGSLLSILSVAAAMPGMAASASADEPAPALADYFGFLPIEIYKLESRIANLQVKDLDGDKAGDILVANNARSRIDLLLTTPAPEPSANARPFRTDVNEIKYDRRMRLESIPVNKEIVSLATGDFDADGKPDLVYYGTPAEVEILFNEGSGRFGRLKKVNSGEAVESGTSLTVGDFNQDGRDDLALLGENDLILITQTAPGVFSEPERFPHTASSPRLLKGVDLNGDKAKDLVILDSEAENPIHVRFGTDSKRLGPEQRFEVETPRAIAFGQIDGKGGEEVLTIENNSGRGRVLTLETVEETDPDKRGSLVIFGFPHGNERGRSVAVGDLDGDHKADVVVTDPSNAQIWLYRQRSGMGLGAGQPFPGLLGGKTVRLADVDGDGKQEIYVLSEQEKQIGRSVLEGSRITFPSPVPVEGEPVALELADLDGDGKAEVIYVSRVRAEGSDTYRLRALRRGQDGHFQPFTWGKEESVALPGLSGVPPALRGLDFNKDGRGDLIVFNSYGAPIVLLGQEGQPPRHFTGALGPIAGASPTGLSVADLDGPAILVAQNTFARRIELDAQNNWGIKDQYNAGRSSAQVLGAAAIDVDGDKTKEIVLLDRNGKSLILLGLQDGVYRPKGIRSIGSISSFEGMHVADLDGDGSDDLLIAGTDRFSILFTGTKVQRLRPIASYETKRTDARLGDLTSGDLNGDGVPDILFADIVEHFLEIASYDGGPDLLPALSFKVFERKSFRDVGDLFEPREFVVGDVDGDNRDDLVMIVHDRILVYRQDPGGSSSRSDTKPKESDNGRDSKTEKTGSEASSKP
jgi:hypothetical protein